MSEKRGPYRQYLNDENVPISSSTRSYNLKKARLEFNASKSLNCNAVNVVLNEPPKVSSVQSTIIEILNDKLQQSNAKIQELEQLVVDLENDCKRLNNELINAKRESTYKTKYYEHHKEQLLNLAHIITNTFANEQISDDVIRDKEILISPNYPEFKMSLNLKTRLCALTERSNTAVFRQLLDGVNFNDNNVFANSNADILINKFPIIKACSEFMQLIRPDCQIQHIKKVLREKCCEARQKLWEKDPSLVFVIEGKELKKTFKQKSSLAADVYRPKANSSETNNDFWDNEETLDYPDDNFLKILKWF